ncbi:unnamed protein product [Effrenium voratum]|uniref:EF-hand domain-containing protein n=1 Tax=Effrenium voratum TaxID=2562239 RepID=A0AA36IGS0_9DINO|nr:unnamed protein product [Effrenium voratum]CAJ1386993.1 unnamed protein product [Effrenium voratum]CAJ1424480.1 unnamed protein product [Effrenium voratum]
MKLPNLIEEKSGEEKSRPLAIIDAKLDRISEQVDSCLSEVLSLKPDRKLRPSWRGDELLPVIPNAGSQDSARTPPRRNSRSSRPPRSSTVSWASFSARPESSKALSSRASQYPSRLNSDRRRCHPHSVDLTAAWQSHAKALSQDIELSNSHQPLIRLMTRSRCDDLWELLDDPDSSRYAWWASQVLKISVIVGLLVSQVQTAEEPILSTELAALVETTFDVLFCTEFACRILSAPSKRSYFLDPLNWADMFSATALPLRASVGFEVYPALNGSRNIQVILLLFLPIVRFLKLLRYFETFRLLIHAARSSVDALPVLFYIMTVITLVAATAIYLAESRANIPSMHHSLWLAIVTMTTVGYGDYYPTSLAGYIIASVLTFVSVLFLALPVGIIGNEFTACWQGRSQVLLKTRMRKCLLKWGYTANDLKTLISFVDADADGFLTLVEFLELVRQMRIGLSAEDAVDLFMLFDSDQNGRIDHAEFVRQVFPEEFVKDTARQTVQDKSLRISQALQHLEVVRGDSNEVSETES